LIVRNPDYTSSSRFIARGLRWLTKGDGIEIASFDFSAPSTAADDNERSVKGNGKVRDETGGSNHSPVETRKKKNSGRKLKAKLGAGKGDVAKKWADDDEMVDTNQGQDQHEDLDFKADLFGPTDEDDGGATSDANSTPLLSNMAMSRKFQS
jgi:hypothetical protein